MNHISALSTAQLRSMERDVREDEEMSPIYKSVMLRGIHAEIDSRSTPTKSWVSGGALQDLRTYH